MSTSPKNNKNKDKDKKNQNEKVNTSTKDGSNNDLFFNIGGININNPLLYPLLSSKEKNNEKNETPTTINPNNQPTINPNSQTTIPTICFNIVENSNKNIKTNVKH